MSSRLGGVCYEEPETGTGGPDFTSVCGPSGGALGVTGAYLGVSYSLAPCWLPAGVFAVHFLLA